MHNKNILIVENDSGNQILMERLLNKSSKDLKIYQAYNGQEALDMIEKFSTEDYPDLILLDLAMPVMDGFDFLEKFTEKENLKKPPVMVLTAIDYPDDVKKTQAYDFVEGYYVKPIRSSDVNQMLQSIPSNET